jgi:hypothetical protein
MLTAVAIFLGGVVGYFVGHVHLQSPFQKQGRIQQGQPSATLGSWETKFKPPASVRLPDTNPVVTFEFGKVERILLDNLTVTITNMTGSPYTLSYVVFGYDSKGSRVSEGKAAFQIGGHESVAREIWLETYGGTPRPASSFLLGARADQL